MSSASASNGVTSSNSSKRKRNNNVATNAVQLEQAVQTESRDASAEEGDTTAPESAGCSLVKTDSISGNHPPNKRQRAGSSATIAVQSATAPADQIRAQAIDPGEPSDTTEASIDIADRVARKAAARKNGPNKEHSSGLAKAAADSDCSSEDKMPPPPIGKLTHPVGYRTNSPPVGRSIRVYADGVFDLFHLGHMRQLEQAKKAFPDVYLMVGVTGDEETHTRKGLTVLSGSERAETVRHCKWVDEVVENCPWIVTPEFLETHKIDYVAHDDIPYGADEGDDIYAPIKAEGKFLVTQRTEGVSTTGIITKIVRDYEKYIARQLKRGTSRQELNISWLKKNELDLKRHVQELRENVRNNWTTTGQELSRELRQFWPTAAGSRPQSPTRLAAISNSSSRLANGETPSSPPVSAYPAGVPAAKSPTPSTNGERNAGTPGSTNEFLTGYTLGLIGGVRSWMTKSKRTGRDQESRPPSDDESEEMESKISTAHEPGSSS